MFTAENLDASVRKTPFMWPDSIIHLFVGGSGMHGATGNKPTDLDINGVYIQPVEMVLGIPQSRVDEDGTKHAFDPDVHVWSSATDKNTAEDVDLNLYSLRKWSNMAASGNTTALEFLFVPNLSAPNLAVDRPNVWEKYVVPNRNMFLSARAGLHFAEFSKAMMKRLKGDGAGKHGQRTEVISEFGYDTKAAMHMLRVLEEGRELMDTGKITLPRPNAEWLKRVRNGEFDLDEIEHMYDNRLAALHAARENSRLPAEVDRAYISSTITEAQIEHWAWNHDLTIVIAKALDIASKWIADTVRLDFSKRGELSPWSNSDIVKRDIAKMALDIHNSSKVEKRT